MILLRTLLWLNAGLAGGFLMDRFAGLSPGDPLHGTLVLAPVVLAALVEIHRWGIRAGGRRIAPGIALAELTALGALVGAGIAAPHFALPAVPGTVAAGLFLLLLHHVGHQLLALRPLLGQSLPRRPSVLFFVLPLVVYLAILPWSTHHRQPDGDEPWYLLVTHSLAYDFDAELSNNYANGDWRHFMEREIEAQPGDPQGPEGQQYSRHNALLPLFLAPFYRMAGKFGALTAMALLASLLAWFTLRLARHYVRQRPGEALLAYGLMAFTAPLLLYSHQVWVEVPATLLSVVVLDAILRIRTDDRRDVAAWVRIGIPLLLLPLLKIRFMLLAAPLVALAWWRAGRPRKPVLVVGALLAMVAGGILLHNLMVYGNSLKIHRWSEVELYNYAWTDYLEGFSGLFFDNAFGLFAAAPLWVLLLPAILLLIRRRHRLLVDLSLFALPYLLVVATRGEWYGGWSPFFRYGLVTLPWLALGLVPLLARRHRAGAHFLIAALAGATLVLTVLWICLPGWTYNFADGRSYLLDWSSRAFGADLARFFPSSVRPRLATWLWPPIALVVTTLLWWLPRRAGAHVGRCRTLAASCLLFGMAAVPLLAQRLPTRVVEVEDPWVIKQGGHLHPEQWITGRAFYRGGWVIREGESLSLPVQEGGQRLAIRLDAHFSRHHPAPFEVQIWADDRPLVSREIRRPGSWRELHFEEVDWPGGSTLTLKVPPPRFRTRANGVALDKMVLEWR